MTRSVPETDYLEAILNANVYDVAIETPLQDAPLLSGRIGNRLFLKREDLQPIFSFKLRGAYNKMSRLPQAALRRGVVAASAGNHAQGVALAAQRLGAKATIVMPVTTPQIKVDSVAALGATVVLEGDSYDDAYAEAMRISGRRRFTYAAMPPIRPPPPTATKIVSIGSRSWRRISIAIVPCPAITSTSS